MRPLPSLFLSSAALLFAVAACSFSDATVPGTSAEDAGTDARPVIGSDDDSGPRDAGGDSAKKPDAGFTGPATALPAASTQIADARCAYYQRCFPAYIDEYMGTLAACKTGSTVALQGSYPAGALFDKAALDKATACHATISCDSLYGNAIEVACAIPKPVNGGAVGAQCNKDNDCASALCNGTTTTACGSCAASVIVKVGDACGDSTGKICPAGSYCYVKCIQEQGLNEPCNGTVNTGTLVCGGGLTCTAGKCEKAGAATAACTESGDCDIYQLAVCDEEAAQCKPLAFSGLGTACTSGDDLQECGQGLRCISPAGTQAGTCQPPVQPGGSCTKSNNCVFGYNCRNAICVAAGSDRPVCK